MRILMVLDAEFPTDIRVDKEIEALVNEGHDLFLLSICYSRKKHKKLAYKRSQVIRIYLPRQIAKKSKGLIFHLPLYRWFWQRMIEKAIDKYKPEVLHIHDLPLALPALAVKRNWGIPLVLDLHENYPYMMKVASFTQKFPGKYFFNMSKWLRLEREAVLESDKLIVVSNLNKKRLVTEYGRSEGIYVVPNTSRLDEFSKEAPSAEVRSWFTREAVNLLYVGGIDASRGLDTVLKGIAGIIKSKELLEQPEIKFVLVGDGSYRTQLEEEVRKLELSHYVQFTGRVPQQKVGEFIACADLCLLPLTLNKHTDLTDPNKLYQYIYYSKPVLAAGTRHLKKRLEELQFGLTYQPGSARDFAAKLEQMFMNMDYFRQCGKKAHQRMKEILNWEQTSLPLKELYRIF